MGNVIINLTLTPEQQVALATQLMGGGSGTPAQPAEPWEAAPAADALPGAPPEWTRSEYPKVVKIADHNSPGTFINVLAKAPLNTLWRPSMLGRIFGKPANSYSLDGSNGDMATPPLPLRTPMGMPVTYALRDGKPIGTQTVLWGGGSYNNDDEVAQAMAAAARVANQPIDPAWAALDAAYAARAKAAHEDGKVVTPPTLPVVNQE